MAGLGFFFETFPKRLPPQTHLCLRLDCLSVTGSRKLGRMPRQVASGQEQSCWEWRSADPGGLGMKVGRVRQCADLQMFGCEKHTPWQLSASLFSAHLLYYRKGQTATLRSRCIFRERLTTGSPWKFYFLLSLVWLNVFIEAQHSWNTEKCAPLYQQLERCLWSGRSCVSTAMPCAEGQPWPQVRPKAPSTPGSATCWQTM